MPSRTTVYGVGVAAGVVLGATAAWLLGDRGRRARVVALVRRPSPGATTPTHIVLPDFGDDDGGLGAAVEEGIAAGAGVAPEPLAVGGPA